MAIKSPAQSYLPTLTVLMSLAMAGFLVYANTLSAPFVFDDHSNIIENPFIRMTAMTPEQISRIQYSPSPRPFANFTFALNYYFHHYRETGYHITNILIHVFTALLVWFIARATFLLCGQRARLTPFIAALLWLVHPLHIQSVTYIVQRMNALAAMFFLLALFCYIQARRLPSSASHSQIKKIALFTGCALTGVLGVASKQNAATLPFILFLYEWFFFQKLDPEWIKKQLWWCALAAGVVLIIAVIYLGNSPAETLAAQYAKQSFTPMQRLLTEPRVLLYYLSLLAFPHPDRLQLIYNITPSTSLGTPLTTGLSLLTLIIAILAAVMLSRRDKILAFAICWYLVCLSVESSVLGLALAFNHRTYLPSVFPVIAATHLFLKYTDRRKTALLSAGLAACLLGFWTYKHNQVWTDRIPLWRDSVHKAPQSAPATNNLGLAYKDAHETEEAIKQFKQTINIDPGYAKAYNNIGILFQDQKRSAEAIPYFKKAIDLAPNYDDAYYNMGLSLSGLKRTEEAIRYYQAALKLNPLYEKAYNNLGIILVEQGETDDALACFQQALRINPYFEVPYNNLGIILYRKGRISEALSCFETALGINPGYADVQRNLQRLRGATAEYGPAINRLSQALQKEPGNADIAYQLGKTYQAAGMTDKAIEQYEIALTIRPLWGECLLVLGNLYISTGRIDKAITKFETLANLTPGQPTLYYNLACLYARQKDIDKAVAKLRQAIDNGYNNWSALRTDPDLENIRQTPYYQKIIQMTVEETD